MRSGAFMAVAASVLVVGCSGLNYLSDNYGNMQPTVLSTKADTWWVFDKPADGKILVQRNPGSAAAQGFVGGLVFNPTVAAAPRPYYQEAAEAHLAQTGRQCQIRDGYLVIEPSWEFRYDCGAVVTGALPGRPAGQQAKK